jgi:hypothetical protein
MIISGCRCDPTYCPELSDVGKNWIESMEHFGDTITYRSSSGAIYTFHLYEKRFNTPRNLNCDDKVFSCWCESQCSKYGNLYYRTDSLIDEYYGLNYSYHEQEGSIGPPYSISAGVFDFSASYHAEMSFYPSDSIFQSITFNNHTYYNVFALTTDTILYPQKIVWKTYYSQTHGIIAFWLRPSQEIFIRDL